MHWPVVCCPDPHTINSFGNNEKCQQEPYRNTGLQLDYSHKTVFRIKGEVFAS